MRFNGTQFGSNSFGSTDSIVLRDSFVHPCFRWRGIIVFLCSLSKEENILEIENERKREKSVFKKFACSELNF
jgi:hypothetical protein